MASTLMTTDQVEGRVNAGLANDVLEGYIDAADADIRRLIVGPLDNFHFSGVVVHATSVRHLNFLRYFETPVRPGGSLKIQDGLTIGGLAYEGSPDFTLTLNATDDSTVAMSMRFPDDGTYRRKESIYVVNGELYAEIPARFMFDSQADYAKWYVPDDARPAITSIEAGGDIRVRDRCIRGHAVAADLPEHLGGPGAAGG